MLRKTAILFILLALALSACAGTTPQPAEPTEDPSTPVSSTGPPAGEEPQEQPYAPQGGDAALARGNAFVDNAELLVLESFPVQYRARITGSLPTPCHLLRVDAGEPTADNVIPLEVYSVVDPEQICVQVLEPFDVTVDLGTLPEANYLLDVQGLDGEQGSVPPIMEGEDGSTGEVQPSPEGEGRVYLPFSWKTVLEEQGKLRAEAAIQAAVVLPSVDGGWVVAMTGNLPTPCHQLRVDVRKPNENGEIHLEAFSVVDEGEMCNEVLQSFSVNIPLEVNEGAYTVFLNGERIGAFTL